MADDRAVFEWHLRRLTPTACRALVRELWTARGFDVHEADDRLVATDGTRRMAIYVYRGGRVRTPTPPDGPLDVVVAPGGDPGAHEVAARHDARVLDAAGLRRLLTYALDRETAADICTRHLGAPPGGLRAPRRWRVRDRLAAIEAPSPPSGTAPAMVVLLALAVVVAALSGAGAPLAAVDAVGSGVTGGDGDTDTDFGATTEAESISAGGDPADGSVDGPVAAPGLNASGIANLTALALAHERALANRSYSLWVDWYFSRGGESTEVQRDVDFAVSGSRYTLRTERRVNGIGDPVRTVYFDGENSFVASFDDGNVTYRREPGRGVGLSPFAFERTLVRTWLSTPRTWVTDRVVEDGRLFYRVVGRGPPNRLAGKTVANYTMVAYVDRDGLVRRAAVEYTAFLTARTLNVRFEWDYGDVGRTVVEPPSFYAALTAGNATATNGTRSVNGTTTSGSARSD